MPLADDHLSDIVGDEVGDQHDVDTGDVDEDVEGGDEDPRAPEASGADLSERKQESKRKRDNPGVLRKAPGAPKRFKSSYICFFMAKQSEIKAELGDNATVMMVSKRSGEKWKELTSEQRAYWEDVAAKDKQRYMAEKSNYTGPWQVPWKRARKDPSAPKRPMSAFLMFAQTRRTELRRKNPGSKNTEVSQILGEMWRNMSSEERLPFVDKEESERAAYKTKFAEWRAETEARADAERRAHAEPKFPAYMASTEPSIPGLPPSAYPPDHFSQPPYVPGSPYPYYPSQPPPYPHHHAKRPIVLGPNGLPRYAMAPYPHSQPAQAPTPAQASTAPLGAEGNPFGPAHDFEADPSHDALSAFEPNPVADGDGRLVE